MVRSFLARKFAPKSERRLVSLCVINPENDPDSYKWSQNAVHYLVRKLKKQPRLIDELERAISQKCPETKCISIPKTPDKRLLISHRRGLPQVIYCRLWRWPDLQSHHQIKAIHTCESSVESLSGVEQPNRSQTVCVNPYHYERSKPSPIESILIATPKIPPDLSTSFEDSDTIGGTRARPSDFVFPQLIADSRRNLISTTGALNSTANPTSITATSDAKSASAANTNSSSVQKTDSLLHHPKLEDNSIEMSKNPQGPDFETSPEKKAKSDHDPIEFRTLSPRTMSSRMGMTSTIAPQSVGPSGSRRSSTVHQSSRPQTAGPPSVGSSVSRPMVVSSNMGGHPASMTSYETGIVSTSGQQDQPMRPVQYQQQTPQLQQTAQYHQQSPQQGRQPHSPQQHRSPQQSPHFHQSPQQSPLYHQSPQQSPHYHQSPQLSPQYQQSPQQGRQQQSPQYQQSPQVQQRSPQYHQTAQPTRSQQSPQYQPIYGPQDQRQQSHQQQHYIHHQQQQQHQQMHNQQPQQHIHMHQQQPQQVQLTQQQQHPQLYRYSQQQQEYQQDYYGQQYGYQYQAEQQQSQYPVSSAQHQYEQSTTQEVQLGSSPVHQFSPMHDQTYQQGQHYQSQQGQYRPGLVGQPQYPPQQQYQQPDPSGGSYGQDFVSSTEVARPFRFRQNKFAHIARSRHEHSAASSSRYPNYELHGYAGHPYPYGNQHQTQTAYKQPFRQPPPNVQQPSRQQPTVHQASQRHTPPQSSQPSQLYHHQISPTAPYPSSSAASQQHVYPSTSGASQPQPYASTSTANQQAAYGTSNVIQPTPFASTSTAPQPSTSFASQEAPTYTTMYSTQQQIDYQLAEQMQLEFQNDPIPAHLSPTYSYGPVAGPSHAPDQPMEQNPETLDIREVSFTDGPFWCSISYHEYDQRIGEKYHSDKPMLSVDGYTQPMCNDRFCIGGISNVNRNQFTEWVRRRIGRGCRLTYVDGEVYVEGLSDASVFVSSPLETEVDGNNTPVDHVSRLTNGSSVKVFSTARFRKLLADCAAVGFEEVYKLTNCCVFRISFVKGWGRNYKRQSIFNTPCWVEVQLNGPLQWIDKVLRQLRPPTGCGSTS